MKQSHIGKKIASPAARNDDEGTADSAWGCNALKNIRPYGKCVAFQAMGRCEGTAGSNPEVRERKSLFRN